jgi:hypothetical protein
MQFRVLFAVVMLVFAARSAVAEPKAYEVVKYRGKTEGMTFVLNYGHGYAHASEMWVTDRKSGKATRFGLDDSNEMRFVRGKQTGGKREIVLKMGMDEEAPNKVEGIYSNDGKQTQFTLRRHD